MSKEGRPGNAVPGGGNAPSTYRAVLLFRPTHSTFPCMDALAWALAVLIGAAGWYYLFYSQAARRLGAVEDHQLNLRRMRLRRVGGGLMLALSVCFVLLFWSLQHNPPLALPLLAGVFLLLLAIVILAWIDVRLTRRLRAALKQRSDEIER